MYANKTPIHINENSSIRMTEYLRSLWAMLAPFKEDNLPLIPTPYNDLEACEHSSCDSIMLVCEIPELAVHNRTQHIRVSPFSEDHFPICMPRVL
jgi:hypothetical protein